MKDLLKTVVRFKKTSQIKMQLTILCLTLFFLRIGTGHDAWASDIKTNKENISFLEGSSAVLDAFSDPFEDFTDKADYTLSIVTVQDEIEIKGTIVDDENGVPILGANIFEKGNESNGSYTDIDGDFSITVPSDATLVISYVGYANKEVKVNALSLKDLANFQIRMQPEASGLDEVVVVGYGKQSKISMVGSVSSITPDKLRTPSTNISSNLIGNISGIIGVQRGGRPGADGASFFIRGLSSYNGIAQNPLILMDGVEISMGDLDNLTPENIESVSVLKDATATAVYGNEGANGVLIITTKEGQNLDKPQIRARFQTQLSMPTKVQHFVRGPEYMGLFNEAVSNRSTGDLLYKQNDIDATRDQLNPYIFPDIDWYNLMFKDVTVNEEANFNIRGGGEKMRYYSSGTFKHQTGLLKEWDLNSFDNGIDIKTYEFQNNFNMDLTPTTSIALKLNTQLTSENGPVVGADNIYGSIMNSNPIDFVPYFPQPDSLSGAASKNILYGNKSGGGNNGHFTNPVAEMNKGYSDNFHSVVLATLTVDQKLDFITKGLSASGLVSFKNFSAKDIHRTRDYNAYQISNYFQNPDGTYNYDIEQIGDYIDQSLHLETSHYGDRNFKLQGSINYSRRFGKHDVGGLFVYNQKEFNDHSAGTLISSLPKRRVGFVGRVTYNFDNRYLFEANGAYNGSENFAKGHRFGFFPSLSVGYVLSGEEFFKDLNANFVNYLKFRASWGRVGNDNIGGNRFPYLADINLGGVPYVTGRNQNQWRSGPSYNRLQNNNITWEIADKFNVGVDLTVFDDIELSVDYFYEDRKDIFDNISNTLPFYFGTGGSSVYGNMLPVRKTDVFTNVGRVKNQGIDFTLQMNKQFTKDFRLSAKGTFTYAHNKIIENNEPLFTSFPNRSQIGRPINTIFGYQAERLFYDQNEINNSPVQNIGGEEVRPGDIKYRDITGDGKIDENDQIPIGNPTIPEIVYGLSTTASYKNWDLSFLIQGTAKTSLMMSGFHPFGSAGSNRGVLDWVAKDRYNPENPDVNASYPLLSKRNDGSDNNRVGSTYWLRDASFLKLKNMEIGYNLEHFRFFISGYNLLTLSKFDLWDPEMGGGSGLKYPTQRIINVGVQLRLN